MNKKSKTLKALVALMLAVSVFFATGCKKEDDDNSNGSSDVPEIQAKRMSKMTWIFDEGIYSSQQTFTIVNKLTWSGNQLTNLDYYDGGELDYTVTFSYDNGRLSEFVRYGNRSTDTYKCVYSGERLTRIEVSGEEEGVYDFMYGADGNISKIVWNEGGFVFNLTWAAGNVVNEEVVGEGSHVYQYDDKKCPFDDTFALWCTLEEWEMFYLSTNNRVRRQWNSLYGGVNVRSYTYTYDGDYPLTCTYSDDGGSGNIYYEYVK